MLNMGRFDLFPRGVMEIHDEYHAFGDRGLAVDPHLLVRYPYALYYFVHPNKQALARQLEIALEGMMRDGSYDVLFDEYVRPRLLSLDLDKRTVVDLPNPLFPTIADARRPLFYAPVGTREF